MDDNRIPVFEDADDDGWTTQQSALLDAVRDVALSADAPGAMYAARHLVRLAAHALDHPLPEPMEREGGLADLVWGKPVAPTGPPGRLRWKFDGGRGAMLDQHDRIVGYYNPPRGVAPCT